MSSWCGLRRASRVEDEEHRPLLSHYGDETSLQRELHKKFHSYQMLRALSMGYMPTTEQLVTNLQTLLSAGVLNPDNPDLSDSGRLLVKHSKQWLHNFIDFLKNKNERNQIQDFIWYLSKSRIDVDVTDVVRRASKSKAKADLTAAYRSMQTVGSLLLTNSDFRLFLSDLNTMGREVFRDTAFALSDAAKDAGKKVAPSAAEQKALKAPVSSKPAPSTDELENQVAEVAQIVGEGTATVAHEAGQSFAEKIQGDEGDSLIYRLKKTITNLSGKRDYSESVSTLALLLQRYAMAYSRIGEDALGAARNDLEPNPAMERAVKNFWLFATSFGDKQEWKKLENSFHRVLDHSRNDPEFEDLMVDTGNSLQKLLTDPDFFEHADEKIAELKEKSRGVGTESSLRDDVVSFFDQVEATSRTVTHDPDVAKLLKSTSRILDVLSPSYQYINNELVADAMNVFVPLLIQAVQHIPIPRLEVATPEADILLENLILEPGKTVNHSSFFPFRFRVETYNDVEIWKARFRTASKLNSRMTIKVDGLSLRAEEVGFLLRLHKGLLRWADEGIASFELDERGIDIHIDVDIAKEKQEQMVTLSGVRVKVHKLSYTLRKSKLSFLGWILKPLLRPILRRTMEAQLARAIADGIHAANRELLYARERLRATRICDPDDLRTFFRAVLARLTPEDDPDIFARVGVTANESPKRVFRGKYAPGSVVKLWEEEARRATERVDDGDEGFKWHNEVFDCHVRTLM